MIFADCDKAGSAAHGRSNQDRPPAAQCCDDELEVLHHGVRTIDSIFSPVRVPMSSRIERDCVVTSGAKCFSGALPRMPGLAPSMLEDDQRPVRISPGVAGNPDATNT